VLGGVIRSYKFVAISTVGIAIFQPHAPTHENFSWLYLFAMMGVATGTVIALQSADLYSVSALRTRVEQLSRVGLIWSIIFLITAAVLIFVQPKGAPSQNWAASWYGGTLLLLYTGRLVLSSLVRHWSHEGRFVRRTIIVGGGAAAENLIHAVKAQHDSDLDIRGVFDDRNDDRSPDASLCRGDPRYPSNYPETKPVLDLKRLDCGLSVQFLS
jgi:FlaA1/EpsC-like NDP-sugar epimerase